MRSFLLLFQFLILFSASVFSQQFITPYVFLDYFRGEKISPNQFLLEWKTITESGFYGAEVYRSEYGAFELTYFLGFVEGNGNSNSPIQYTFVDSIDSFPSSYTDSIVICFLKIISINGEQELCCYTSINFSTLSDVSEKYDEHFKTGVYPNPFNSSTTINFTLPNRANVLLKIFNSLGQEVALLVNEEKNSGNYSETFNASNLSSGIYYCTLQIDAIREVKKLILLK